MTGTATYTSGADAGVAFAGGRAAAEGVDDLGTVGEVVAREASLGRSAATAGAVGDDDPRLAPRGTGRRRRMRQVLGSLGGSHPTSRSSALPAIDERVASSGEQAIAFDAAEVAGERHVLGEQHHRRHAGAGDEAPLTAGAPGGSRRRARPRSSRGRRASCAARRRGHRRSWSGRTSWCPTPARGSRCGVRTAPGSSARKASRSNSLAVSATRLAVDPDPAGAAVDRAAGRAIRRGVASPRRRRRRPAGRPGDGPDAGQHLAHAERLGDVVVGAELEAEHAVELVAARGDHDDRHVGRCADRPAHVAPVHVGQAEVEQHHVVAVVGGERAAARWRRGRRRRPSARGPRSRDAAIARSSSTSSILTASLWPADPSRPNPGALADIPLDLGRFLDEFRPWLRSRLRTVTTELGLPSARSPKSTTEGRDDHTNSNIVLTGRRSGCPFCGGTGQHPGAPGQRRSHVRPELHTPGHIDHAARTSST